MATTSLKTFEKNGRTLCTILSSFSSAKPKLPATIGPIFSEISSHLSPRYIVAYVRDAQDWATVGKYAGGFVLNKNEIVVSLNDWKSHTSKDVTNVFAHELHHLGRWKNKEDGYGYSRNQTLGQAIIADGMACLYAERVSGLKVPWVKKRPDSRIYREALKRWQDSNYDRNEWRFSGPLGKWVVYRLGYALSKDYFQENFDLKQSIEIEPDEFINLLKLGK